LLSAGSLHLLPDSAKVLENLHGIGDYPLAPLLAYSTVIILLIVHILTEYFALNVTSVQQASENTELVDSSEIEDGNRVRAVLSSCKQLSSDNNQKWTAAIVLLAGLGFHSFLSGLSLGSQKAVRDIVNILGPVLAHKTLAAATLGSTIIKANATNSMFYILIILFSLTTPIGVVVGLAIVHFHDDQVWSAACLSLAAGTFIFLAMFEIIPDSLTSKTGLKKLFCQLLALALGYGLMAMLAVWV
jgi:zinc transporter 1/2/3